MNKVLSLLFTMFVSLLVPQTISAQVKFDFNASNHAVSASGVSDGDIIEAETYYMDGVTLTISPAAEGKGTPNRYWGTGNGPQLRMYSGTIMIDAGSKAITKIIVGSGKWNASNTFNDVASADGNWEGSAANVILAIAGNTQMNYIEVTVSDDSSSETKAATRIVFADGYETKATCGKDESVKLPIATVMADSAAVEGAAVTWSLSGDSLAQLDGDVLKIFNGVQGTVDVKAEYAGDDSHFSCSKTYTLTIYKGYMLLSSIIDDVTSSNPKWDNGGEYASYWFVNEDFKPIPNIVTYANGRYIYLTNGTENLLFYGINTQDLKQGDVISGALDNGQLGAVWGKLYRYNNLPEFAFTDMDVQIQDSVTVVPKTITVDQLGDNINAYVEIENAKFVSTDNKKNLTFNAGETEFLVYNQFNVPIEALEEGATYTLTGMGAVYKTTRQLYLTAFDKAGDNRVETTVVLGDSLVSLKVGNQYDVPMVAVMSADGLVDNAEIIWTSSNEDVATISNGVISVQQSGSVTFKAEFPGNDAYLPSYMYLTLTILSDAYTSFSALQADATSDKTPVTIDFGWQQVVFVYGDNAYITDSEGNGLMIYSTNHGLQAGDKISGTAKGVLTLNQENVGITNFSTDGLELKNAEVYPVEKTIGEISTANQSTLVTLRGVTYDGNTTSFIQDGDTIGFYDRFRIIKTFIHEKKYDITGVLSLYHSKMEISPRFTDDVVLLEATEAFPVTIVELENLCYSGDGTLCKLTFDNLLVAFQGGNHTYLSDGNHGIMLYGKSGLRTGDRISGEITGVPSLYGGTPEFGVDLSGVNVSIISSDNNVPRKPVTAAELNECAEQLISQYVKIDNVTFDSSYTIEDNFSFVQFHSDSIAFTLHDLFNYQWEINQAAVYTLEGVVEINKGNIRIVPLVYTDLKEKQVLPENAGTLERPFTVAEAIALASSLEVGQQTEQAYYVKGYISSINYEFDEKYGNATFQISDMDSTGTSFYIYRTQYLENTMWMEGYTQVAVGDEVIVYGLFTNYKGTPETVSKQTYIYSLNGRTKCETIVEPIEGISYSWESPEGEPIQWGGTIAYVNGDGNRLNYFSSGYYSICLNGKKANVNDETASANAGKMVITLDKPLNAGDTIAYTAYINKDISKKASPYILFENGSAIEGELFSDEANIYEEFLGVPTLKYSIVPEEAAGSKTITLTRSQTGTNLFITKLQVIENTHPIDNPTYAMGDVNTDGFVDVTDVVCIIDNILEKYSDNFDASLADVNGDNEINVTDVVMVIESILGRIELSRGAEMIDRSAYTAFQMDLTIPAGYVLESVSLTDIAKDSHTLAYNMLADGRCRVVVCSMNNEALPGAWDEVISLNLRGKGEAQVNIDRAVFVTIDGERHELMLNPTSIAEISNLKSQTSNLYDLQGRKIEKSVKGILIENGKKIIRK